MGDHLVPNGLLSGCRRRLSVVTAKIGTITVKLVIFDFDGTLVDSRKLILE
jgi:hypothetical protein